MASSSSSLPPLSSVLEASRFFALGVLQRLVPPPSSLRGRFWGGGIGLRSVETRSAAFCVDEADRDCKYRAGRGSGREGEGEAQGTHVMLASGNRPPVDHASELRRTQATPPLHLRSTSNDLACHHCRALTCLFDPIASLSSHITLLNNIDPAPSTPSPATHDTHLLRLLHHLRRSGRALVPPCLLSALNSGTRNRITAPRPRRIHRGVVALRIVG